MTLWRQGVVLNIKPHVIFCRGKKMKRIPRKQEKKHHMMKNKVTLKSLSTFTFTSEKIRLFVFFNRLCLAWSAASIFLGNAWIQNAARGLWWSLLAPPLPLPSSSWPCLSSTHQGANHPNLIRIYICFFISANDHGECWLCLQKRVKVPPGVCERHCWWHQDIHVHTIQWYF